MGVCVPFNERSGNYKCELAPTPTPIISETPTPTPIPECEDCDTQPTPTVTPTPTIPSPTSTTQRHENGTGGVPSCTDATPQAVANIYVDTGIPNDGRLEVRWTPVSNPDATKAHIRYSETNGEWRYALLNTDNDGHEVIGSLQNGVHYWFIVNQVNGCAVGPSSQSFDPLP